MAEFVVRVSRWSAVALAVFVFLFALACGQPGHFVPGESPTVTPHYNPQGTPSAPIVITSDLPEGWRWQYSRDFPAAGKDNWHLLGTRDATGFAEIMGAIVNSGGDCWVIIGIDVPELECISRDEVGKQAIEILVANYESRPEPTAAPEPETILEWFKQAFEPKDPRFTQPVLQLDDGSFSWTASVRGSGIYQITKCPPGYVASASGRCVQGEITNATKYTMTDVKAVCDGERDNKTSVLHVAYSVPPGDSASWVWVRDPIVELYTCRITWTAHE